MVQPRQFDWVALTKEFVNGPFVSVADYVRWSEKRKKEMGEPRPSAESIRRTSARLAWVEMKAKRKNKMVQDLLNGTVDESLKRDLMDAAKVKSTLTKAMIKIIVDAANNPGKIELRGDISDIINDLKRSIGEKTRESEMKPTQISLNQANIANDSFRKQLEAGGGAEQEALPLPAGGQSLDEILKAIPADQLEFIDGEKK